MEWLILLFHIMLLSAEAAEGRKLLAKKGCQARCGVVDIPYPFGIGPNCSLQDDYFQLTCNTSDGNTVPFHGNMEVLSITLETAQARLYNQISWQCYTDRHINLGAPRQKEILDSPPHVNPNNNSYYLTESTTLYLNLTDTVYRLSSHDNMFTVIGCGTLALNRMSNRSCTYRTGCVSTCYDIDSIPNGTCSGNGCCQTSIPAGIDFYNISFDGNYSRTLDWVSTCSYAVIMATDSLNFTTSYITKRDFLKEHNGTVPLVLDWSIGNEKCEVAKNSDNYACASSNSLCTNSTNGPGYICLCSRGYEGNPYLEDGCQDVNECDQDKSICSGNCINIPGSYNCTCPPGTEGDATRYGKCIPKPHRSDNLSRLAKLAIGFSMGLLLLLFCIFVLYIVYERRRLVSIREKYFHLYGGRLLLEELQGNLGNSFSIFTEKELKEATNNFHQSNMLGQGGYGAVYKGTLKSSQEVAIKKCKIIDERNKNEFGKEILILSKINHINIVRILGCCLEVEIPILVYEYIPNGTLFDLLHSASDISFRIRLKIAQEAAEALAYLHSWASPPIVHCDVKSSNILLGENFVAKVSDFGASALAPSDEDQFLTLVQGTRGYLDPQCMQTGQLTVKSDVYSFGVVLLELLTRKKPFYFEGPEERCVTSSFLTAMKDTKLVEILDVQILDEESMNLIMEVAELARECLNMEGEKRPQMREVAERLVKMNKVMTNSWGQDYHDDFDRLRVKPSNHFELEMTSNQYSLETKAMLVMDAGR